jgi:hypothetical protein
MKKHSCSGQGLNEVVVHEKKVCTRQMLWLYQGYNKVHHVEVKLVYSLETAGYDDRFFG